MNKCTHCGADLAEGAQCSCIRALAAKSENLIREIALKPFRRTFKFDRAGIDEEKRTVPLSFSSETKEVVRWFGVEILDHSKGAMRTTRLNTGAPLLVNHNPDDQVGKVEEVSIDADRKGRAIVRFGKSARAEEIFQDVLDGIRESVSVGYATHALVLEEERDDGHDVYRVTDWEPYEISLASVPADIDVGVGRSIDPAPTGKIKKEKENRTMKKCPHCGTDLAEGGQCDCTGAVAARSAPPIKPVDVKSIEDAAGKKALDRASAIIALGDQYSCTDLAREHLQSGKSVDQLREAILEKKYGGKRVDPLETPDIGLTGKEIKRFSLVKAIYAMANPGDKRAVEAAAFEFDASLAVGKKLGRTPQGLFVPFEVQKRDMTVGTDPDGGYLVGTDLKSGSFIDILRNAMKVQGLGATILSGLIGDIAIPKQTGGAQAYWLNENGEPTESQPTLGQVGMTPKTVGAYTDISRKLLQQSSIDVENFVKSDLAIVLAIAIDLAAINGSGADNQPRGILQTTGIGSKSWATDNAPLFGEIVDVETEVSADNALIGSLAYLVNATLAGKLKQTEKASSTGQFILDKGEMNGYTTEVSNQVPTGKAIFGNWRDLMIAMWGTQDILVDPYTGGASGAVRVRILQDVDTAVRHAESFAQGTN